MLGTLLATVLLLFISLTAAIDSTLELDDQHLNLVLYSPRHVHISYGESPSEMFVTWSTIDDTNGSFVEYGPVVGDEIRVKGTSKRFEQAGSRAISVQYIHRVRLRNLNPSQKYRYHCGSDLGWSDPFTFQAMRNGTDWSPRLVMYGDLGNVNAQSLTRLQRESLHGAFDAIIHNGDFAYDMDTDSGFVGDAFMEQIQPIAAFFPYMTCPGNHEHRGNFSQYKNRFTMPGRTESMSYSWNMGPIHFVSFSTEVYYYLQYGVKPIISQYQWLKKDLEEANRPENRAQRPWIVTYGHRPMYCSNNHTDDCANHNTLVRVGIPWLHTFGLEDLFMDNGVDLAVWAHQHSYERMWPIYNYTILNGTDQDPYRNPKAVVHVTTGSAGCEERHSDFTPEVPPFTAFRILDYGYSRLHAINKTHLYFEQVSDDQNGKVVDSFTLVKEKHGSHPRPSSP